MELINAKIKYMLINKTFVINNIDIEQRYIIKFKNENIYINYVINYIKDNIIKKYSDLKHIKIHIEIFNRDNYIHQFIVYAMNKIHNKLSYNNRYNRLIIIYIYENDNLIFIGNVNM
jgi:hypothetical protein